jgi:hypothetical protein
MAPPDLAAQQERAIRSCGDRNQAACDPAHITVGEMTGTVIGHAVTAAIGDWVEGSMAADSRADAASTHLTARGVMPAYRLVLPEGTDLALADRKATDACAALAERQRLGRVTTLDTAASGKLHQKFAGEFALARGLDEDPRSVRWNCIVEAGGRLTVTFSG